MSTSNQMHLDVTVVMQEANALEDHYKRRNLYLAQSLSVQKAENQILLDKINGLEADLRLARGEGGGGSE